jgi:hypothetical protein
MSSWRASRSPVSREVSLSTPCSNADAVIEWVYVPYIVEEEDLIDGEEEQEEEEL